MQGRTFVIVPTLNERENIGRLLPEIFRRMPEVSVLVVDDRSRDGTSGVVRQLQSQHPGLFLMERKGDRGLGRSYREAFQWVLGAKASKIITMDADFSHPVRYLPSLISGLDEHDLVVGSRYVEGITIVNWSLWRLLLSYLGNRYVQAITGLDIRDLTSGFCGYRASLLEKIPLRRIRSEGYCFQFEMKYLACCLGASHQEISFVFYERDRGKSKLSRTIVLEALWMPWLLRLKKQSIVNRQWSIVEHHSTDQ